MPVFGLKCLSAWHVGHKQTVFPILCSFIKNLGLLFLFHFLLELNDETLK
jgi:hypothetical protein